MAGFYGKLPAKGDFVSRGLSRVVTDKLYEFFQLGLHESREQLGKTWLERYAVAPIWHFHFAKGVLDDSDWMGVWIPSADKVGRHFPLVLMAQADEVIHHYDELEHYFDWFTSAETMLLDVLDENADFERFCEQVEALELVKIERNLSDVDEIFATAELTNEMKVNAALEPDSPFEKALQAKIGMLESIVSTLCQQLGHNYADLVEAYIDGLSEEQRNASMLLKGAKKFAPGVNLADSEMLMNEDAAKSMLSSGCIWLSEGSEDIPRQVVLHDTLPVSSQFQKFIKGF
ncbi:type VI secretion system-associated protein TagF [Aestuariibacter salexigens]|uniref:type VI secretion system-associated protein TagF n=1 Tax=Aestuariibacter salexigens TaxID=226010 RepID=UPI0004146D8C|nr:type VI secretion system-associated protein TagF [Aestuariibacter salexigens]